MTAPKHAQVRTRNIAIIAHIHHGKSTLTERIVAMTSAPEGAPVAEEAGEAGATLSAERASTTRARALRRVHRRGEDAYTLHLIDTPGHIDLNHEVSRALSACEGALLLIDATRGVEAQTLANAQLAVDMGVEVIPVINKIDHNDADTEQTLRELEDIIGFNAQDAFLISAWTGEGVAALLDAITEQVSPPLGAPEAPLRALVVDRWRDPKRGSVALVRVVDGTLQPGDKVRGLSARSELCICEIGVHTPKPSALESLQTGQVGFITLGDVQLGAVLVGDTLVHPSPEETPASSTQALAGSPFPAPNLYCCIHPTHERDTERLGEALEKLRINDPSLWFEGKISASLGTGFLCGFPGLIHLQSILEQLSEEPAFGLLVTSPSPPHLVIPSSKAFAEDASFPETLEARTPEEIPKREWVQELREPFVHATIFAPGSASRSVLSLSASHRAQRRGLHFSSPTRVLVECDLPSVEASRFFEELQRITERRASIHQEHIEPRALGAIKVDVFIDKAPIAPLSFVSPVEEAKGRAKELLKRLKKYLLNNTAPILLEMVSGGKTLVTASIPANPNGTPRRASAGDEKENRVGNGNDGQGRSFPLWLPSSMHNNAKKSGGILLNQRILLSVFDLGRS